jgi:hypothetical protein
MLAEFLACQSLTGSVACIDCFTLFLRILLSIGVFCAVGASSAEAARLISPDDWVPQSGDHFYVDLDANWGYILHPDSADILAFPVATGIEGTIRWLGMTYNAKTPEARWVTKTSHIQSDRFTFGPTGYFLRLYKNGDQYTRYGVHSHASVEQWLTLEKRYKSAGCIIVNEQILQILKTTFEVNEDGFTVITTRSDDRLWEELAMRERREITFQI